MTSPSKPVPDNGGDNRKRNPLRGASKAAQPHAPTKSGLVPGLGESNDEIVALMRNLRARGGELLAIGQYLQPSGAHLAVERCARGL